MSERIVVALQSPVVGPPQLYLLEPDTHAAAGMPLPLDMDAIARLAALAGAAAPDPETDPDVDFMERFGKALFDNLNAHPAFKDTVMPLLRLNPNHDEPFYLYFEHRMQALEELPWEALFAPDVGFLSQNRDFGIGRMLNSNSTKSEWLFEPPLKIAAVLGAGGGDGEKIGGAGQWKHLRDAVVESRLPVRLRVLTCEAGLRDEINRAAMPGPMQPGVEPWVTADLIQNRDQLFAELRAFAPHILHFFCHGIADTKPQLQVASYRDWGTDAPGSILIEGEQLKQNADLDGNIWLVTLNCCETAKPGHGPSSSLSMPVACNLVCGGIPVAVGMRERIDDAFADKFCGLFYQALLAELRRRVDEAKNSGMTDVHWACGLFQVRQSMYQELKSSAAWTVPVMHTRLKPFQLKLNPAHDIPETLTAAPAPPGMKTGLTAEEIHEYGQELMQLAEDRKLYVQFDAVVARIDQRTAEINAILRA